MGGIKIFSLEFDWWARLEILFTGKVNMNRKTCTCLRDNLNKRLGYDNNCIPQFTNTGEIEYMTKEEIENRENTYKYE